MPPVVGWRVVVAIRQHGGNLNDGLPLKRMQRRAGLINHTNTDISCVVAEGMGSHLLDGASGLDQVVPLGCTRRGVRVQNDAVITNIPPPPYFNADRTSRNYLFLTLDRMVGTSLGGQTTGVH